MLKLALVSIWAVAATAAGVYGSVLLPQLTAHADAGSAEDLGTEMLKTEMISIPVVREGDIVGYVIVQLGFAADRRLLAQKKLEPEPYLTDAVFRVVFSNPDIDFRHIRTAELDRLTVAIAKEANTRVGGELVRNVLVQQLNFLRREDIRTNWIGKENGAN